MLKGDISNEISKRLIVTYEALTEEKIIPRKILGVTAGNTTRRTFRRDVLNRLWRYTDRFPLQVEMVNFGVSDEEADRRLQSLDAFGTSPVNFSTVYDTLEDLLAELPYRIEVAGILDVPENQARYGLAGIGISHLDRII
jgi:hypothetical protein